MKFFQALLVLQLNLLGATAFVTPASKTFTQRCGSSAVYSSIGGRPVAAGEAGPGYTDSRLADIEQRRGAPAPAVGRERGPRPGPMGKNAAPLAVQGGSLKTWSFQSAAVERVQVVLGTEGRPLNADVDLWHGPDNTPQKMRVYVEDGSLRPFNAVIETPRGPNTIAIRNTGQLEFPLAAFVQPDTGAAGPARPKIAEDSKIIQGGALKTFPFEPAVESVQVLLMTDGRPLNSRIELLQGPNNNKQVIDIYIEDGRDRPFFCVLETPGSGNVIRVCNTATVEFPLTAWVEPYQIGEEQGGTDGVVIGGDGDSFMGDMRF